MKAVFAVPVAIALVAGIFQQSKPSAETRERPIQQSILADDIGTRVQIVGRLGRPLGEMMTIEADCVDAPVPARKADMGWDFLRTTEINGAASPSSDPIRCRGFWKKIDTFKVGKRYRLRGYEHGEFRWPPEAAFGEYTKAGNMPFATATGYGFETLLVVATVQEL